MEQSQFKTKSGAILNVTDMTENHIENTINLLERKIVLLKKELYLRNNKLKKYKCNICKDTLGEVICPCEVQLLLDEY